MIEKIWGSQEFFKCFKFTNRIAGPHLDLQLLQGPELNHIWNQGSSVNIGTLAPGGSNTLLICK
jgi:hypothetical protein